MRNIPLQKGQPRYIRIYDAGERFADRFTVVFSKKRIGSGPRSEFMHLSMGLDPRGISSHGFSDGLIDRPGYSHLGKKIDLGALPERCQARVRSTYQDLWAN